jgi:hypothetical protein
LHDLLLLPMMLGVQLLLLLLRRTMVVTMLAVVLQLEKVAMLEMILMASFALLHVVR